MSNYGKKTQIYVSDEQWAALMRESWLKKTSIADVIRRAIDEHLAETGGHPEGFESALRNSAGLWKSRKMESSVEYVDKLRAGWSRRERR